MGHLGIPELILVFIALPAVVLVGWLAGRVCRKAGFSPWLGVAAVVPFTNFLLLVFLALADWPSVKAGTKE